MVENLTDYFENSKILNHVNGIEIKMTEGRGRGIFAAKPLHKGDILVVEKALAEAPMNDVHITE